MFRDLQDVMDSQEDYEEHKRIMHELAVIQVVAQEIQAELKSDAPKWAPIARKHLPALRAIFWHGDLKEDAQALIEELTLAQTMPLGEVDLPYEADSYTGEKFVELDPVLAKAINTAAVRSDQQWYADAEEVQREIALMGGDSVLAELDEDTYDGVRRLMAEPAFDGPAPTVFTRTNENEHVRMVQELRSLGYSELEIEFAMAANRFSFEDEEEAPWYEDGEIPSVPLNQEAEQELHQDIGELIDLKTAARPYIKAIQQRRTEHFDYMRIKGDDLLYERLKKSLKGSYLGKAEFKARLQAERAKEFRRMMDISQERTEFLDFLQAEAGAGVSKQAIALVFLSIQDNDWALDMKDAGQIVFPDDGELVPIGSDDWDAHGTLLDFIQMFGDVVLDEALDPIGMGYPMSEQQIIAAAEGIEAEILEFQFVEASDNIIDTRVYARGVFNAAGSNIHEAGMDAWRWEKSKVGEIAYQKAVKAGKTLKQAWAAFWNAGTITSVNSSGVKVLSHANGKVQLCDWGLARWKLAAGEIFISKDDRLRLKSILLNNNWGKALRESL